MVVTFMDEIGIVQLKVDKYGISFCDGKAYFTGYYDGTDYKIETKNIIEITPE